MNVNSSFEMFVCEGKRVDFTKEKLSLNKVVFIFVFQDDRGLHMMIS